MGEKTMILLAENNPMLRARLKESLEARNYEVWEAYDANSAIYLAEGIHKVQANLDLIAIDPQLLGGCEEVEKTTRRLYPKSKRVYIEKPIQTTSDLEEFLKAVDEALAA